MKISKFLKLNNYVNYAKRKIYNLKYPSDKIKIVQATLNDVSMLVRANEDVGRGILNKSFEKDEIKFLYDNLPENGVFIDIGANVGLFSLIAASKSKKIEVHAFDPIKLNTSLIQTSAELNGFTNIKINQTCVGDYDGFVSFSVSTDSAYSSMRDSGRKKELEKIDYPIIKLDNYVLKNNISKIDFIKVDVEGAEKLVIDGSLATLKNNELRPKLMMLELYDVNLKAFNTNVLDIVNLMASLDYRAFVLKSNQLIAFEEQKHKNIVENIFFVSSN